MAVDIGVSYEGGQPLSALRAMAEAADDAGAGTLWAASHLFQREPIVGAAMVLSNTRRLGAALMAMSPYTMHPVHATMAAAALDEWFPGRIQLCFGSGAPRDLDSIGIAAKRPLSALSESIRIARALLGGETVTFKGERFQVLGRRLSSGRREIPIVLAASGPKMLELAGAEADGVLISAGTSPAFIAWALTHVGAGEARSGRTIRKSALAYASIGADSHAARNGLRRNLAFILRGEHHTHNLNLAGTDLDQARLTAAFAREDWAAVDALITDDVIANHTISGTPTEIRSAFATYRAVGLDELVLAGISDVNALKDILAALKGANDQ